MTQRIKVAGPGFDFPTLSAAIASIPPGLFVEPIGLEVHSTAPQEGVVIPATLLPTSANPLIIFAFKAPAVVSAFYDIQYLTGSLHLVPPPQPRLVRPVMTSFDIQADNVQVNGFKVVGNIFIKANNGVIFDGNVMEGGQVQVVRAVAATVTARISNNEIRKSTARSGVIVSKANGVKLWHNTVLQRREDSADLVLPTYGFEIVNSVVDSRNNVVAAKGAGAHAFHFTGTSPGQIFNNNSYMMFDGAKRFEFREPGDPVTVTDDLNVWKAFIGGLEAGSITADPEFRRISDPADVDLDVSNTSPTVGAAPAIADITNDVRGEARPSDFVTMGAHEHAEIVTDEGKVRFLELLGGLSTQPVTKAVLGKSGVSSIFGDFTAHLGGGPMLDPLFTPVDMEGASVPALPGSEGTVIFRPSFQVTLPIYGELIDTVFDRADELGLMTPDNKTFLLKRMHSIPFDAVGFMHTQMTIPVEIMV